MITFKKLLEILKNHFLSSARFRNVLQPHYIAKWVEGEKKESEAEYNA